MYIISFRRNGVINKKTQYGKSIITNTVISASDIALRGENTDKKQPGPPFGK
jgi:hypothetical protein